MFRKKTWPLDATKITVSYQRIPEKKISASLRTLTETTNWLRRIYFGRSKFIVPNLKSLRGDCKTGVAEKVPTKIDLSGNILTGKVQYSTLQVCLEIYNALHFQLWQPLCPPANHRSAAAPPPPPRRPAAPTTRRGATRHGAMFHRKCFLLSDDLIASSRPSKDVR